MDANKEEAIEKAHTEMLKALNHFGPRETLSLLVEFSNEDAIVNELLVMFPSIVAVGDFFYNKPVYEIDKKTFQDLVDANPNIWIRKERDGGEEGCKTSPEIPKKRRITKKKKRRASPPVIDRQGQSAERGI